MLPQTRRACMPDRDLPPLIIAGHYQKGRWRMCRRRQRAVAAATHRAQGTLVIGWALRSRRCRKYTNRLI